MPTETSRRIAAAAAHHDSGWSILSGADSVTYATEHVVPIETGASPFAGGPTIVIVSDDGTTDIVVSNLESASARAAGIDHVHEYVGFSAEHPEPYLDHYRAALDAALDRTGLRGRVCVEPDSIPSVLVELLDTRSTQRVDGRSAFARARMVKTEREREALRRSASMATLAQLTARDHARSGMSELELSAVIRGAVEHASGERVAFAGDLLSGVERTSGVAGWATSRRIEANDTVLADLAPRVAGYWSDSCSTFSLGTPSGELSAIHDLALRALHAGIDAARPGVPVNDIDLAVRSVIRAEGFEYGHHTGHGIGTSVHEFPRIIPGETTPLEEGMVILLEPGVYQPGVGGVRLEWMFEVAADGLVRLTEFEHELTRTR